MADIQPVETRTEHYADVFGEGLIGGAVFLLLLAVAVFVLYWLVKAVAHVALVVFAVAVVLIERATGRELIPAICERIRRLSARLASSSG